MLVLTARDRDRVDIELNGKKLTLEFFVERRRVRVGYQGPMEFRVTRQSKTSALGARVRALRAPKAP